MFRGLINRDPRRAPETGGTRHQSQTLRGVQPRAPLSPMEIDAGNARKVADCSQIDVQRRRARRLLFQIGQ